MKVFVILALPDRQQVVELELEAGATAQQAVIASRLNADARELAVFGRQVSADRALQDGDRVEILRPLATDPKDARRKRARRRT